MFSVDLIAWLEAAGHASWVRVACYVVISSVCFWAGLRRSAYRWISLALAFWFASTISIPFVIAIDRSDLLWQQRGMLTIAASILTLSVLHYTARDIRREMRNSKGTHD